MAWAYAWLKAGYFPSPLVGILSVDDGRVRYVARSDDARTRSRAAEELGRPELTDPLASPDGAAIFEQPVGGLDSSGAQAFAGAMKGKRESAALREALKEL